MSSFNPPLANTQSPSTHPLNQQALLEAINRTQAIAEFELDGTVVWANSVFLNTLGYALGEVVGLNHRMFCRPKDVVKADHLALWERLQAAEAETGEFCRVAKSGAMVWFQASYNPVLNETGKPVRVVIFATDITQAKLRNADLEGKIQALNRVQAVIEFTSTAPDFA